VTCGLSSAKRVNAARISVVNSSGSSLPRLGGTTSSYDREAQLARARTGVPFSTMEFAGDANVHTA